MKKLIKSKKGIVALLVTLTVVAVSATGAYAYFVAPGGVGSGTATTGSASAITLSSSAASNLYPGGADVPVTVTISNPGGASQRVNGTIVGKVTPGGVPAGCSYAWFQADTTNVDVTIPAGGSATVPTNMRMQDSGTDQNACQGKTITTTWQFIPAV